MSRNHAPAVCLCWFWIRGHGIVPPDLRPDTPARPRPPAARSACFASPPPSACSSPRRAGAAAPPRRRRAAGAAGPAGAPARCRWEQHESAGCEACWLNVGVFPSASAGGAARRAHQVLPPPALKPTPTHRMRSSAAGNWRRACAACSSSNRMLCICSSSWSRPRASSRLWSAYFCRQGRGAGGRRKACLRAGRHLRAWGGARCSRASTRLLIHNHTQHSPAARR